MSYCHAYQEWEYDQGNSDTPPTIENAAQEVANDTGYAWDEDDIAECCEQIMGS